MERAPWSLRIPVGNPRRPGRGDYCIRVPSAPRSPP